MGRKDYYGEEGKKKESSISWSKKRKRERFLYSSNRL